jgi:CHAD domain-containing protein
MTPSNISLQSHEALRSGLLRVVDSLIGSAADGLSNESRNGEQDIHQERTTIKRLRALLRLIRPAVDPAFFNRENARLRTAARLLSFARDTEVALRTLKTLPVSNQIDQDSVRSVLSGFEVKVERPNDLDETRAEVRRRLAQTRRNFHQLKLRGTEREIELGEDSAFHRWRIRAKNLYYELEFLESVWPKRLHRLVSRLSKLQDEIGLDHDAAVLRAWLKKTPENFGGSETVQRVVGCLDSQTQKLRKRVVPLGQKIWGEKPSRFARRVVRHWDKR